MFFIRVENNTRGIEILTAIDAQVFDLPWNLSQWRSEVENYTNHVLLISMDEDLLFPVGFITYGIAGEDMELKKIAVLPQYRLKNVASLAIERMLDDARREDVHNVIAEVAVTNLAAIRLYEKHSFYKIYVRKKYYSNLIDAIVMQKEI